MPDDGPLDLKVPGPSPAAHDTADEEGAGARNETGSVVDCVVLSYNSQPTLSATLEAVRAQTMPIRSVTVVDNGSSDGSPTYLEAQAGLTTLVLPTNLGVGGGHNVGWRRTLAQDLAPDFLWALEHDSEPSSDCLEQLLRTARAVGKIGRVGAIVPQQVHPHGEVRPRGRRRGRRSAARGAVYVAPRLTFNASLIAVEAIREVGLLREDFFIGHEDREFAWRMDEAGFLVVHDTGATVLHRSKGARRRYGSRSVLRDYYSARNELYLRRAIRREPLALPRMIVRSAFHVARVLLMRDRALTRTRARITALIDGLRGDLGPKDYPFLRKDPQP